MIPSSLKSEFKNPVCDSMPITNHSNKSVASSGLFKELSIISPIAKLLGSLEKYVANEGLLGVGNKSQILIS